MAIFEITLSIKQNGVEVFGAPLRRRAELEESSGLAEFQILTTEQRSLPFGELDDVTVLVLRTSQPITYHSTDIAMNAGGVLVAFDVSILPLDEIENTGAETAVIKSLAGGS